jgi:hypothetical protein
MKIPLPHSITQRRLALLALAASGLAGCSPAIRLPSDLYAADTLYIAGHGQTSLLQFSAAANGNDSPKGVLNLPPSFHVASLATDADGKIYVGDKNPASRVLVYAADSADSDTPTRTLILDASVTPSILAVDPDGLLYVGTQQHGDARPTISVYSATADGTVSALRTVQLTRFEALSDLAIDEDGNLFAGGMIVLNDGSKTFAVEVFSPKAAGSAAPLRTILIPATIYGIAVREDGELFASVMLGSGSTYAVEEFAATAKGPATPVSTIYLPRPVGGVPTSVAVRVDGAGAIFASLTYSNSNSAPSVFIYSYDGNASRSANPRTQLVATAGIATLALTN